MNNRVLPLPHMKKQLLGFKRWFADSTAGGLALTFAKFIVLCVSIYITIGSLVYPDWWRLFLWGGGVFETRLWNLGWQTVKLSFGQFWPFGFLAIAILLACGFCLVYQFGRQGPNAWKSAIFTLPRWSWLIAVIVCVTVCLSLWPRTPQTYDLFWQSLEMERWSREVAARLKGAISQPQRGPYEPPENGIYLYLNEGLVTRQFKALMPPLGLTSAKEMSASAKDIAFQAGESKIGSLSAKTSTSRETELTKEAPPVSAPYAAQQLIGRLAKSDDTVVIGLLTGVSANTLSLTNQLKTFGVELTVDQLKQLEKADREHYNKEVLKADRAKVLFYSGAVDLARTQEGLVISFESQGPTRLVARGLLKREGLGDHLSLAIQSSAQPVHLVLVSLYGVIETREESADALQLVITPYAIW